MTDKANAPNWEAIRQEYIETNISMRALAEKHKVKFVTLGKRAEREKWTELRDKAVNKASTKLLQKAANARASFADHLDDVAEGYLAQLEHITQTCKSPYQIEKAVAALERLYRIKGLDAAGQLAAKQLQNPNEGAESAGQSFVAALAGAGARVWDAADEPDNVEDTPHEDGGV